MAEHIEKYIKFIGLQKPERQDFWELLRENQKQEREAVNAKTPPNEIFRRKHDK